jgi:hypothetical protein
MVNSEDPLHAKKAAASGLFYSLSPTRYSLYALSRISSGSRST